MATCTDAPTIYTLAEALQGALKCSEGKQQLIVISIGGPL